MNLKAATLFKKINWKKLIVALAIPQLAGLLGSLFTSANINTWYATIAKPSFNPPGWIFGPVWTILFILMGISLYLVWDSKIEKRKAMTFFGIQMILNVSWSILFFGLQSPLAAAIEIFFLIAFIILTMKEFFRINKVSAYLLLPYLLWTSFASILNITIVLIN